MPPCASNMKLDTVWEKCVDMPVHRYRVEKIANSSEDSYQSLPMYGLSKLHNTIHNIVSTMPPCASNIKLDTVWEKCVDMSVHRYRVEKIANSTEDSYQSLPLYGLSKLHTYYQQYWEHYASVCFQYEIRYRMGEVC